MEEVIHTEDTTALFRVVVLLSRTLIRVRNLRTRWLRRLFDKYNDTQGTSTVRGQELRAAVARDTLATTPRSTPSSLTR